MWEKDEAAKCVRARDEEEKCDRETQVREGKKQKGKDAIIKKQEL